MFSLSAFGYCGLSLPCQGRENIAENSKAASLIPITRIWRRLFLFTLMRYFPRVRELIVKVCFTSPYP